MKYTLFLILLIFITFLGKSQSVPYQKLDSISTLFSKIQYETNGYVYNDGNNNYEVSFPRENFKVWAYNHLATSAVYKKINNKETLAITENIDLSKASSFIIFNSYTNKKIFFIVYRMSFPKGSLKTELYENGTFIKTISEEYLDFFLLARDATLDKASDFKMYQFFNNMIYLVYRLKQENKQIIKYDINELARNWNLAVDQLNSEAYKSFLAKYPNTLYDAQCKQSIGLMEAQKKAIQQKLIANQNFVNNIADKYKFKKGLTLDEFANFNPESEKLSGKKGDRYEKFTIYSNQRIIGYSQGPYQIVVDNKSNRVSTFQYVINSGKDELLITKTYNDLIAEIKANVDIQYIKTKEGTITVEVPGSKAGIFLSKWNYNKWTAWGITFY
jgi:hypothetical protein